MNEARAFTLKKISFAEAENISADPMAPIANPLFFAPVGALPSGSEIRVVESHFENFVQGAFKLDSFSSLTFGDECSKFVVESSGFVNNTGSREEAMLAGASCCAGAISIRESKQSSVLIHDAHFVNNTGSLGGALLIQGEEVQIGSVPDLADLTNNVTITRSTFAGNRCADCSGGGVYALGAREFGILDSVFDSNVAGSGGGIFSSLTVDSVVSGTRFMNNTGNVLSTASGFGGGAYVSATYNTSIVENCEFTQNIDRRGGGLRFADPVLGFAGFGGSIFQSSATVVSNSSFVGNVGARGGGIDIALFKPVLIENSTLVRNIARILDLPVDVIGGAVNVLGLPSEGTDLLQKELNVK